MRAWNRKAATETARHQMRQTMGRLFQMHQYAQGDPPPPVTLRTATIDSFASDSHFAYLGTMHFCPPRQCLLHENELTPFNCFIFALDSQTNLTAWQILETQTC